MFQLMPKGRDAPGADEPHPKRVATAAGLSADKETQRLFTMVIKLCLSVSQQTRALKSILLTCYSLPASESLVDRVKEATTGWSHAVKDKSRTQRKEYGEPHIHAFNAFMGWMLTEYDKDPKIKQVLTEYQATLTGGMMELAAQVRYFHINKCFDRQCKRLEVTFRVGSDTERMWSIIEPALMQRRGWEPLPSMAPPGDLERKLQKYLDGIAEETA
mmetsp:Transcript_87305/g.282666  ORF Transcript_87305/g.282666 Transcript_87305/m.282666 type:complete len:216 (+) Transcript_87305:136-783(+)